ncbi:MAG: cation:proton antiporter [Candidatus Riflebacteria bacterium]|nr:cation:proton antiporter [Candidatus Riflebacteria bacterium]
MTINTIAVIILLGGWSFARLFEKLRLPNVLGMVAFGILCSLTIKPMVPQLLWDISPFLKSLALIVILLRAGLGISRKNLQTAGKTSIFMSLIPCLFEGIALTFVFMYLFNFAWQVAGLTAFMLSAVSLAVTVPAMLDLRQHQAAMNTGVPTIILAGCSVDNVLAITMFSAFLGMATRPGASLVRSFLEVPVSILAGVAVGAVAGLLLVKWLDKRYQKIRATEKTLILLCCALMLAEVGNLFHIAALLGVMTIGFIMLQRSERIAHEIAAKLGKIWVFAEIILFVLIGLSLEGSVAAGAGFKGLIAICIGLIFRSLGVLVATSFRKMSRNERLLCIMAYLPKATTQAALGSVAMNNGMAEGSIILAIAVLAIVFTSPLGLIGIKFASGRFIAEAERTTVACGQQP